MQLYKLAVATLIMGMTASLAHAGDAAPAVDQSTLGRIVKDRIIVVSHCKSSVPFSYCDNQQEIVGYPQNYSDAIAGVTKKKLNKPGLQAKLILVTSQSCIPLLQNDTSDFKCGSAINNPERRKQTVFSDTVFVVGICLLVKKGGPVKNSPDPKDKAVVVTSGVTPEILLHKPNDEKKTNMRIISAKDHGNSFRILGSGCATVSVMDDALPASRHTKAKRPDDREIVGTVQSKEAYGCMLRGDDPSFKVLVGETVTQVQISGETAKWFDRWFKDPTSLKDLDLNFELSDSMRALLRLSNDKALN